MDHQNKSPVKSALKAKVLFVPFFKGQKMKVKRLAFEGHFWILHHLPIKMMYIIVGVIPKKVKAMAFVLQSRSWH